MTGSTPALIITVVVVLVGLAAWIVAVFYADAHPEWQRRAASRRGIAGRAADPAALPQDESRAREARQTEPSAADGPSLQHPPGPGTRNPAGHGRTQKLSTASPRDHHPARMPLTPARR